MYDAAPSLFRGGGEEWSLYLAPDSDWYRRAATCMVRHPEYGSRRFIVLVTVDNKFHAYPTSADVDYGLADRSPYIDQAIKTNIPEKFVKRTDVPAPPWCRQPSVTSRDTFAGAEADPAVAAAFAHQVPQYLWNFNSTCTKVCCVVFEDLEQPESFNYGRPEYLASGEEVREALPGLLELGIDIALTGDSPEDFTFGLRVLQAIRPSLDGQYFLSAAYSWAVPAEMPAEIPAPPPKEPPPNIADIDDLVVITGHVYHTSSVRERFYEPVALDLYAGKGLLRVRNLTKETVVREFVVYDNNAPYTTTYPYIWFVSGAPPSDSELTENVAVRGALIAHDLRILAFAVQQVLVHNTIHANDYSEAGRQVQRLQVYAYNKLVQEKYLDPDHPLNPNGTYLSCTGLSDTRKCLIAKRCG